ncbi:MAG: GtrA family protein [Bacteroides sp.]
MGDGVKQARTHGKWWYALVTFLKAQLSAQLASLVDFVVTVLLVKCFALFYLYATLIGSVVGGMVNCVINYRWVFADSHCKSHFIVMKYSFVWIVSIALNTWGTYFLTEWLSRMPWLNRLLSSYIDDLFIFSKIVVAVLVALLWNYQMQRLFVYRNLFGNRNHNMNENEI